jgi:hypothetical protein
LKKNSELVLSLLFIVVLIIAGIVYFRTDFFHSKPKDDRKVVNQVQDIDGTTAKVIRINSNRADIHLHKSNDGQMQAKINGKVPKQDNVELKWTKEGKELYLKVIYKENDVKTENAEEKNEKEHTLPAKLKLDISIPVKIYDSIEIKTSDGKVVSNIPLQTTSEIKVDTKAGSIKLTDISGDQVHFRTDEGNIQLKKVRAGYMTLTSWEGDQYLQDYQGGNIKAQTHSGNITYNQVNGGVMTLDTKSGNIKVDQIQSSFLSYEITTEIGNVAYTFHTLPTNLYLALTSESGKMKNSLPIKNIIDKDADYYQRRYIKGTLGNGIGNLLIDTTSGNIDVALKK